MKNSKGKHQHNFTEQTTQAILNQYRRKGKNSPRQRASQAHAKSLTGINRTKIFRYTSNTKTNLPRRQTSQAILDKHFTAQASHAGNIR